MSKKIVFMGTPEFAVESLKTILNNNIEVAAVVTAPDRPAGRGQQLRQSAVKEFAISKDIKVLQPEKLKSEDFIQALTAINADLFVVVAFRMLPEIVWSMPSKGTINLHGSLLPNYRGAAPINWAVINGEKETGATTFFIEKEIDTGKIIDSVKIPIGKNDSAGQVHDHLMVEGAKLLANTVAQILNGEVSGIAQSDMIKGELKDAPKIFKSDCQVNWDKTSNEVHNMIRGMAPYPTAWTKIEKGDTSKTIKLFTAEKIEDGKNNALQIKVDSELYFGTADGWIKIIELQLEGKKRMKAADFIKGFNFNEWNLV